MSFSIAATLPKKTLRYRRLQIARETCPRTTAVNTQLEALVLGCEAKQLSQQFETFIVYTTGRLEDHRDKLKRSAFEIVVIASVLLRLCVTLARLCAR